MNENVTLREALERLPNKELEALMQEQIDLEVNGFVPELTQLTQLRQLAKNHFGVDNVMQMDRVASEAFRVYALRAAGMR